MKAECDKWWKLNTDNGSCQCVKELLTRILLLNDCDQMHNRNKLLNFLFEKWKVPVDEARTLSFVPALSVFSQAPWSEEHEAMNINRGIFKYIPLSKYAEYIIVQSNSNCWQPYLSKWQIQTQTLASDLPVFSLDPKPAYEEELIYWLREKMVNFFFKE